MLDYKEFKPIYCNTDMHLKFESIKYQYVNNKAFD